jgi:hypothetical protein
LPALLHEPLAAVHVAWANTICGARKSGTANAVATHSHTWGCGAKVKRAFERVIGTRPPTER